MQAVRVEVMLRWTMGVSMADVLLQQKRTQVDDLGHNAEYRIRNLYRKPKAAGCSRLSVASPDVCALSGKQPPQSGG